MPDLLFFDAITDADPVGGKGYSLARLSAAGLPVPPGFVITTDAYRRGLDSALTETIREAYRRLGGGAVAVRSSATAEDGAETSFAGQQETFLGVVGDEAVLKAITACWKSLHTERAIAYRRQQGVTTDGLAMAVVVQQLVAADVAGVLFTRDPHDPTGRHMAAEASWGLGEVVVSGKVTPDRFRLDRETGAVVEKHAGRKTIRITPTGEEQVPGSGGLHGRCLSFKRFSSVDTRRAVHGHPRGKLARPAPDGRCRSGLWSTRTHYPRSRPHTRLGYASKYLICGRNAAVAR